MMVKGNYRLALLISIAVILSMLLVDITPAKAQATRPRRVTGDPAPSPVRSPKNRVLTAKDHLAAEHRLAELGYWTGKIDGRWDEVSRHALIAFQKVVGLKRTGRLTARDYVVLMEAARPKPLETGPAHIEVDLVRQVLFVVDDENIVTTILPVSTGNGKEFYSEGWVRDAITHPGRYKVYNKIGGWRKSPLGLLYYPVYFMWGTAIHGSPSVPAYPDSHGCVRIPMFAAQKMYRTIPVGMPVIIHRGELPPKPPPIPAPVAAPVTK